MNKASDQPTKSTKEKILSRTFFKSSTKMILNDKLER